MPAHPLAGALEHPRARAAPAQRLPAGPHARRVPGGEPGRTGGRHDGVVHGLQAFTARALALALFPKSDRAEERVAAAVHTQTGCAWVTVPTAVLQHIPGSGRYIRWRGELQIVPPKCSRGIFAARVDRDRAEFQAQNPECDPDPVQILWATPRSGEKSRRATRVLRRHIATVGP